jgi:hypothetical protein
MPKYDISVDTRAFTLGVNETAHTGDVDEW